MKKKKQSIFGKSLEKKERKLSCVKKKKKKFVEKNIYTL
jgi:hypothetical protein